MQSLSHDTEFAEVATNVLESVVKTFNSEKRILFSHLLANVAIREKTAEREEGASMAALLDQLEFRHIRALDKVMQAPFTQSVLFWGAERSVTIDIRSLSYEDRLSIGDLEDMGLVDLQKLRSIRGNQFEGEILVLRRGTQIYDWIKAPTPE